MSLSIIEMYWSEIYPGLLRKERYMSYYCSHQMHVPLFRAIDLHTRVRYHPPDIRIALHLWEETLYFLIKASVFPSVKWVW